MHEILKLLQELEFGGVRGRPTQKGVNNLPCRGYQSTKGSTHCNHLVCLLLACCMAARSGACVSVSPRSSFLARAISFASRIGSTWQKRTQRSDLLPAGVVTRASHLGGLGWRQISQHWLEQLDGLVALLMQQPHARPLILRDQLDDDERGKKRGEKKGKKKKRRSHLVLPRIFPTVPWPSSCPSACQWSREGRPGWPGPEAPLATERKKKMK